MPHLPQDGLNGDSSTLPGFSSGASQTEETSPDRSTEDSAAILALRNFIFDICNQNGGGHGGSAIGMAAIGVALWKYVMRYNPSNPDWFDRDRFVLSNGHTAMFLYALNHLTGFDNWTMEQIKGYGSAKLNGYKTICHAHPEIEDAGVEVTTGPLGQGIANAVGLAIASKNLAARFNRPSYDIVKSRVYCMTGDGCLMEGVALESISLAGSLGLDNLVLIYDNNQVTCDGPLDWINTEDVNTKMKASGWHVLDIADGSYDVQSIVSALESARSLKGKPTFINIRTVIGLGTQVAGTYKAHHGAFDKASIEASKCLAGQNPVITHIIPPAQLIYFRERKKHGEDIQREWDSLVSSYTTVYPSLGEELKNRRGGSYGTEWLEILNHFDIAKFNGKATREVNGVLIEKMWKAIPALCGGGADLVNSNKFPYLESDVFHPSVSFGGRYIRYGIREHAMAAISNGLAAYNPGTFLPLTATFLMFYLYAAPGVRMGALSHLPVIHCATHDSFAEGQNGPTHQPVEVDSLYRAMPNLNYIRPADAEETIGAWIIALGNVTKPTILSLGRDPVGYVPGTDRQKVQKGAYVIVEANEAKLTLVSCGTNLHYVVAAAKSLSESGVQTRVVSAPSFDHFDQQDSNYKNTVFPLDGTPIISVEEYVATTWARYATASIGMTGYGYSASNASNYDRFGLDTNGIEKRVRKYMDDLKGSNARMAGWRQL
ncbi:Transketolase, thiamine diphosphate binding domain-containing protein [Talaromyces proteolyticus]|uniref:Transketolase, thiamine diphosphate binding domain-containing protein n=1 Tax=Talaromyces proteolyticus TaxID=1131652 RepID=A0AAD4KFV1_9EURO|nr:Transketolase, thiamine diphosphate binding domain-containing protein [Talaromyces proteolyticus]KAH8691363.1 Transketolase, thiamine diphosphate binding domain-containing protein [Talaromyces proteolyticus]